MEGSTRKKEGWKEGKKEGKWKSRGKNSKRKIKIDITTCQILD